MIKRLVVLGVVPALLGVALVGSAGARSVPAMLGGFTDGNSARCMNIAFNSGSVGNAGSPACGLLFFELGLPADNSGSKTVTFTVKGGSGGTMTECRAMAIARDGTMLSSSSFSGTSGSTWSHLAANPVTLPSNGLMWLDCNLPHQGSISVANYSS